MTSGVYIIRNQISAVAYIGSSIDMDSRWRDHRKMLRRGTHCNAHLQAAWNKYGENVFTFEHLHSCDATCLIALEQSAIDAHVEQYGWKALYNINRYANSCLGVRRSEDTRRKIALAHTGKKWTSEQREKIMATMVGRRHSPEHVEKIAAIHRGRKRPPETGAKISAKHKGRKLTLEWKEKVAESVRRRGIPPAHREAINRALRKRAAAIREAKQQAQSAEESQEFA